MIEIRHRQFYQRAVTSGTLRQYAPPLRILTPGLWGLLIHILTAGRVGVPRVPGAELELQF
jgi:hypothetical protein